MYKHASPNAAASSLNGQRVSAVLGGPVLRLVIVMYSQLGATDGTRLVDQPGHASVGELYYLGTGRCEYLVLTVFSPVVLRFSG